jgi:alpha-glucosidase
MSRLIPSLLANLCLVASIFSNVLLAADTSRSPIRIISPDSRFTIELSLGDGGRPVYSVNRFRDTVIQPSGLGLTLAGGVDWTCGFDSLELVKRSEHDSTWSPVWGERSTVRDRYRTATIRFRRKTPPAEFQVEVRAYEEGVALRYIVEEVSGMKSVRIESERSEFRLTADHNIWAAYSAQGKYSKVKLSEIKHSVERPCVLETADNKVIAIAEAALVDYSRMRLRRSDSFEHTLVSNLHDPVVAKLPLITPWRVIMAAESAGQLLERNDLLLNLNQPCAIPDTSWIKPGKVIREVSLSTEGGKACVDFCVKYGLQFIEYDAGWYGDQGDEKSDARTVSRQNLDLQDVIRYAKERGISVIVYVNRRHLERQLDELLPLYKSWGLAGIKYGFVQHGSQKWTAWMHDVIRKTAEYGLMVDVHDEYRMTGWQRTYPNFMTAEGIGGDETRPPHEQALANLFNRMIAGPADHTFCYYNGYVDQTSSHASQLAKAVCFFSPWQFLFWYDRPSAASGEPELEFFKHLPTTWDEIRVLHSKIGQYAVIARRKGSDWYVGCLNAGEPRSLQVPLGFLPAGATYDAHIYRDDPTVHTRTKVGIERRQVESTTTLEAALGPRGGMAIRLVDRQDAPPLVHPGLLHSREEISLVKSKIAAGESPWAAAWKKLREHKLSSLDRKPNPRAAIVRGAYNNPNLGANALMEDGASAYAHALQWCLTGRQEHAQKAREILNAYATTVKSVGGHDARLLVGMAGIKYLNAAELLRHTWDGWPPTERKRFETFLRDVLYPVVEDFYPTANGNWDAAMIQTMMAMGVFLDDRTIFGRAVDYYLHGYGNGAISNYLDAQGECQESGRDQAHTQMGLGYLGCAAEIAWKQGIDLYSAYENRLLTGYEYTAKYNLGHDVPYEPYRSVEGRYYSDKISAKDRGGFSSIYERVYHHYHGRRNLEMPWTREVIDRIRPERWQSEFPSWATLMISR